MTDTYREQVFVAKRSGRYYLDGMNTSLFTLVLVDNFSVENYCALKWKEVVGDGPILIESKYKSELKKLKIPIIFISNSEFPFPIFDHLRTRVLKRRSNFVIVHAQNTDSMI